jgi:nicotinamidase-related amidase
MSRISFPDSHFPLLLAVNLKAKNWVLLCSRKQNDIATPRGKITGDMPEQLAAAHTIENTQAVLRASRQKGVLVVHAPAGHRPGYPELPAKLWPLSNLLTKTGALVRGTWGAEIIDQLKPLDDEIVVYNYSTSAFSHTELDIILRNKGISELVLSGLVTNWVVESTARDAVNRGYFVYILHDCCASHSDEMHNWTLTNILSNIGGVVDSKTYIAALQSR